MFLKLYDSTIKYGGIAQLGERLNGIQEVSGWITSICTSQNETREKSVLLELVFVLAASEATNSIKENSVGFSLFIAVYSCFYPYALL